LSTGIELLGGEISTIFRRVTASFQQL